MRSMMHMIIYVTLYIYTYIVTQADSDKESPVFCCRACIARSMAAESVSKQCVFLIL